MQFISAKKICTGMEDYGEIPREKELLHDAVRIAWPSVLESLAINLTGVVDTIMVGTLGTAAIAAVGLTTQPKLLILAPFMALNVAVSSIVARRKGENNPNSANRILRMALILTISLTVVMTILGIALAEPLLLLVGAQTDTLNDATGYFQIIMAGNLFTTLSLTINGAQKGIGNTRITLVTNMISNGVNVVFNYLLIGGNFGFPALGVRGAAIATVVGTVFGCVLSIFSVSRRGGFLSLWSLKGWIADKISIRSMLKVGFSALVEQICMRIGFLLFVMTVANLGTVEMAAHQIGMNMMSISFSIGDGLSVAAVTLIGQSLGRKRPDLAKIYGSIAQRIGLICALFISIIYILWGRQIFHAFDSNPVVMDYGAVIMRILSLLLILQIEQVVQFGCLRGAGDTMFTAVISLISVTLIRPGMSFLFCYPLGFGLIGAWIGTVCDQLVRFILSYIRFKKGKWVMLKL